MFIGAVLFPSITTVVSKDTIDPSLTFYPTDDTKIRMKSPDGNYGDSDVAAIRNRYGADSHPDYWEEDALIKFNISLIPADKYIISATLNWYYCQFYDNNPAGHELTLYRILEPWNEETVTWNTRPMISSELTSSDMVPSLPGEWMSWEVTNDLRDFVDGSELNYGWQIMDENFWGEYDIPHALFRTKEFTDNIFHPYLIVETTDLYVDVEQVVFDRGFPIRHAVDGDWAGAQNFTPTLNTLTKSEIYLRKFGSPNFDLTVELREDSITGTLIDTLTFTPDEVSSSWEWFELDFLDIAVQQDTDYFIVIPPAPSGLTNSYGYEWGYAFGDQYDDGSFWFTRDGGSLWRDLPTMYEFMFRIYGYN